MKAPKLNQIELFARKGGTRANAGRKAGESTSVIRVPTACLPTVTEILTAYRTGVALNPVTEIKDDAAAEQAVHALREYFRGEYMMGASDSAFIGWIDHALKSVTEIKGGDL